MADILLDSKKAFPSVSIIVPVDKKRPQLKVDEEKMKALLKLAEEKLSKSVNAELTDAVITKMHRLAHEIDYHHLSDGLGLFISPKREKVVHFSFPVKEKVIVDKTFEVRDLMQAAKSSFSYVVLAISDNKVRVFRGADHSLTEEHVAEMPYSVDDVEGEGHTRVGSFTSFSSSKNVADDQAFQEKQMEKYLLEIDHVISTDPQLKDVQLIICASKRASGHFKDITKNGKRILGYVHGNFDRIPASELLDEVKPVVEKHLKEIQEDALKVLEKETGMRKVASGIQEVWKSAYNKEGRILYVEKGYYCPAKRAKSPDAIITHDLDEGDFRYISDAVDDVIEMVLKYGGDVVFVEDGKLPAHDKIALIRYY